MFNLLLLLFGTVIGLLGVAGRLLGVSGSFSGDEGRGVGGFPSVVSSGKLGGLSIMSLSSSFNDRRDDSVSDLCKLYQKISQVYQKIVKQNKNRKQTIFTSGSSSSALMSALASSSFVDVT